MVYLVLRQNERPLRLFPIGAKAATHVPLAIVEDIMPEARIDVLIAAPEGVRGTLMLDLGWVEV
jgi:assimilatory nitrate reductase catalytic subunit